MLGWKVITSHCSVHGIYEFMLMSLLLILKLYYCVESVTPEFSITSRRRVCANTASNVKTLKAMRCCSFRVLHQSYAFHTDRWEDKTVGNWQLPSLLSIKKGSPIARQVSVLTLNQLWQWRRRHLGKNSKSAGSSNGIKKRSLRFSFLLLVWKRQV